MSASKTGPVDLHVHSTASDGSLSPADVVDQARRSGLVAVALTDHDSVAGVEQFLEAARNTPVEAISGVEIGAANDPERGLIEVHILGYLLDHREGRLNETLDALHAAKEAWLEIQLSAIEAGTGIRLTRDEVLESNPDVDVLRRPHIWKAIEERHPGVIEREPYYRRTDYGGDMHAGKAVEISLEESIALIRGAGGVPVLAHPGYSRALSPGRLIELCFRAGVAGVEVAYPYFYEESKGVGAEDLALMKVAREGAEAFGLIQTGGSDFHGPPVKTVPMGVVPVEYGCLEALKDWKRRNGG